MNNDDDLTASHWDDVISPNTQSSTFASLNQSYLAPDYNGFQDLAIDDKRDYEDQSEILSKEEDKNEEDKDEDEYEGEHGDEDEENSYYLKQATTSAYDTARSELDQLHELKKEERNDHKNKLMSELASGNDFDHNLEESIMSPTKLTNHDSLFNDSQSPIKIDFSEEQPLQKTKYDGVKKSLFKRPRKFTPQKNVKHLTPGKIEENTDDNLGPLGNINKSVDTLSIKSDPKENLVKEADGPLYDIKDTSASKNTHVSIQRPTTQANGTNQAKNQLEITVSDPMKVGDITNAYIVYTITTKVKSSSTGDFPPRDEPYTVTRRYKDFRWVYRQLQNNHVGRIIPPPPTKQTYIGRFNESFIENRRLSLEKMLNKIGSLPLLSNDPEFILFLTSEDLANDSKDRDKGEINEDNELIMNSIVDTSSNNSGFMSSIFSMSNKVEEPDEYFNAKKHYIDSLEENLKNFYATIELIINQRVDIINIVDQLNVTLDELAGLEISKNTTNLLVEFNNIQAKLKENLDRNNLQDHLTLGFTIEEYLRIIESIKFIFTQRLKIYQIFTNYSADLTKKKNQLVKYKLKNQVDKIGPLTFEVDKLSTKAESFEEKFKLISETIKLELENFEFEKIDDFRNSVEIFIESAIESLKESIELWETFYERQNLGKY